MYQRINKKNNKKRYDSPFVELYHCVDTACWKNLLGLKYALYLEKNKKAHAQNARTHKHKHAHA